MGLPEETTWKDDVKDIVQTYGVSFMWRPLFEVILLFVSWNLMAIPFKLPYLSAAGAIGVWLFAKILLPRVLHVYIDLPNNRP